eukprot:COSAG04_NODE_840_length_9955_cov_5.454038_2_plen_203_part_00
MAVEFNSRWRTCGRGAPRFGTAGFGCSSRRPLLYGERPPPLPPPFQPPPLPPPAAARALTGRRFRPSAGRMPRLTGRCWLLAVLAAHSCHSATCTASGERRPSPLGGCGSGPAPPSPSAQASDSIVASPPPPPPPPLRRPDGSTERPAQPPSTASWCAAAAAASSARAALRSSSSARRRSQSSACQQAAAVNQPSINQLRHG